MRFSLLSSFVLVIASGFSVAAHARSIVETQQSTAYDLPDGWSVLRWDEKTGEATLKNGKTGDFLKVERYGLAGEPTSYPNSEEVASGRTLTWKYTEDLGPILPGSRLNGEVRLTETAIIRIVVWPPIAVAISMIDKEAGLAAMRSISASVKILGPRKCWPPGECPPGEVKTVK